VHGRGERGRNHGTQSQEERRCNGAEPSTGEYFPIKRSGSTKIQSANGKIFQGAVFGGNARSKKRGEKGNQLKTTFASDTWGEGSAGGWDGETPEPEQIETWEKSLIGRASFGTVPNGSWAIRNRPPRTYRVRPGRHMMTEGIRTAGRI